MIERHQEEWSPVGSGHLYVEYFLLLLLIPSFVAQIFYTSRCGARKSRRSVWEVLGNPTRMVSGGPVDGSEGGQKGFNDVEAKRDPKLFMARERAVTKQN